MIKFLNHTKINKQKWDACIEASPDPCLFSYSWYLDAVAEDWGGLVLNDYEAIMPLAFRSKYSIAVVYQPFFTRYYALSAKGNVSDKMINEFLTSIPERFRHIEFNLKKGKPAGKDYQLKERKFQVLDLNSTYEGLWQGYSDNTKRNIKKAQKAGLILKEGIAASEIVRLFKSTKGQELELLKAKDYVSLGKLMDVCVQKGMSESWAVYNKEKELLAAAFFMMEDHRFTYLKSGLTEKGKSLGAMHLLMDALIQKFSKTAMVLDFGGSSVESVARFYKSFGGKDYVYLQVKKDNLPGLIKWARKIKAKRV